MYQSYSKAFFDTMTKGISIEKSFSELTNTDWWEQYMANMFQFSAAKNIAEMRMMQELVFDENHNRKSFSQFRKDIQPILDKFNSPNQWLRVEYDCCVRGAIFAEEWQQIWQDRDLFPYAIYRTREDPKVRPEHAILNRLKFRIDDVNAQKMYGLNDWNCRCWWETTDNDKNVLDETESKEWLNKKINISKNPFKTKLVDCIPPEFRYNCGIEGIFSKKASYFKLLENVNSSNYSIFAANDNNYTRLEYKHKPNSNEFHKGKDLIFQNKKFFLNVRLDNNIYKKLSKKANILENLRNAIAQPDEIWGRWKDEVEQKTVLINYIKQFDDYYFIIETDKSYIQNAYFLQHSDSLNLRRVGIKFLI